VIALLASSLLLIGDADTAKVAEQSAFAAINDKRWCDAAALFQDAFDAEPDVDYLLNAAKAASAADDFALARQLAAQAVADAPARAKEIGALLVKVGDKTATATCPARAKKAVIDTSDSERAPNPAPTTPTSPTNPTNPTNQMSENAVGAVDAPDAARAPTPTTNAAPTNPGAPQSGVFVVGAVTAGVGGVALLGSVVVGTYAELQLRDTTGTVARAQKSADLSLAVPVAVVGVVGVAVGVVGAILLGVGG
jgi:hypothetical protein